VWNKTCTEGKRLLDYYLMALTTEELARREMRHGNVTVREAAAAHDALNSARNRYWQHVERHLCRAKVDILVPRARATTRIGSQATLPYR
jgi:hypothetical protein